MLEAFSLSVIALFVVGISFYLIRQFVQGLEDSVIDAEEDEESEFAYVPISIFPYDGC